MKPVLIVGAGMAGLTAARALADHGREVVVIEGRERIGGRCWTVDGVDLGAHWIHGTEGNPVTAACRRLGVPTLFVGGDSSYTGGWEMLELRGPDGKPLGPEEKQESILLMDEVRDGVEALRRQIADQGGADLPLATAVERVLAGRELAPALRAHLAWHLAVVSRDDWAAGAEHLSLLHWDEGYEVYGYGDSVFVDGAGALMAKLAAGLDVRLGLNVTRIEHDADAVRVVTDRGTIEGEAAVVTLPLGVLKAGSVAFDPPLPERKREAIARLGMGALTKLILRFDAPFWPPHQYVFGYVSKAVGERPTNVVNLLKTHGIPALALLIGGARGRDVEGWPPERQAELGAQVVRELFGEGAPAPRSVSVTTWERDPYARGAYSYLAVGATPDDIDALAEPVGGRLLFAGEATSRSHWACLHGAHVSGLREAARLTGDASLLPSRHFTENRRWRELLQRADRFFNMVGRGLDPAELDARAAVLKRSAVFASVPPADLRTLATMFERRALADGERLCAAGDPATCMYAVASGEVVVELPDASAPLAVVGPGAVVGEYGLFSSEGRTAGLSARGATSVLSLDYQRFKRFLLAFPDSMMALMSLTVARLHERQSGDP